MQRHRRFTLIELLVVVSILAVLMSLLLPSLGSARQASYSARCAGDLKTVITAAIMYTGDNDDYLLPRYAPGTYVATHWSGWWYCHIVTSPNNPNPWSAWGIIVHSGNYIDMGTAQTILLDKPPAVNRSFPNYWTMGYGYFSKSYTYPHRIHNVRRPSESIWFGDSAHDGAGDYTYYNVNNRGVYVSDWWQLHYRHPGNKANVAFPDGHVASVRPTDKDTASYWSLWSDMN